MKGLSLKKKRSFGIISIMIAMIMFVMSGVSSFASDDSLGSGGDNTTNQTNPSDQSNQTNPSDSTSSEMKYIQLNNCVLAATGQEMNYTYTQNSIPFVVKVNEDKGWVFNNSTATIWTPEELTASQQESLLISMRKCLSLTTDTKVLNTSIYENYKYILNAAHESSRVLFVNSIGTSKVGNITVSIGNNQISVIDNSSENKNLFCFMGSFKKSTTEIVPNFGVGYEYPKGNETCKLDEEKAETVVKDYVDVVDCRLLGKEDNYDVSASFNCIPYVITANGSTVNIWTQRELTTNQKNNFTLILKKLFTNTLVTEVKKATDNAQYNYYTNSDSEFTEYAFAEHYVVCKNNAKISVKDTKDGCMSWYVGGHLKLSTTQSTQVVIMKDCRTVKPDNTQPSQPDNTQPSQPDNTQPSQPDNTQPSQPDNTQPNNNSGNGDAPVEMTPSNNNCNNNNSSNNEGVDIQEEDNITIEPDQDINNQDQTLEDGSELYLDDSTPDTGDNNLAIYYAILGIISLGMAVYILKESKSEI